MLKIGFHTGPGGNAQGIRQDYWDKCNADGLPIVQKSIGDYGSCKEAINISDRNVVVFRTVGLDLPNYDLPPSDAATLHANELLKVLPEEFLNDDYQKQNVWIELTNEADKNRANWLGEFALSISGLLLNRGLKVALFGFAAGEPEDANWEEPHMLDFLKYASENRDRVAVSLHEYSYSNNIWEGTEWNEDGSVKDYWMVGRFTRLNAICRKHGFIPPTILITEFGWHERWVPGPVAAIPQIKEVGKLYEKHDNVLGAAIWYLGMGYGGIADLAQKLIRPVGDLAITWENEEPPKPPDKHKAIVVKVPQEVSKDEWLKIAEYAFSFKHTLTASHDDTRTILFGGNSLSYVKVFEPQRESQKRTIEMLELLGYRWEPHYINGPPEDNFRFEFLPTEYPIITQHFGNNPKYYSQWNLPGHEGIDFRAPDGTRIFAVAPGTVSDVVPFDDGHNYGIRVRVSHKYGYETTYAHMKATLVDVGQDVIAGQVLGLADNTGKSFGSHCHLTLKHIDAYEGGPKYIGYPYNIIDPTPFVSPLLDPEPPVVPGVRYDLAEFMVTKENFGPLYEVQTKGAGQQRHQTQVVGPVFYHTKDNEWEELMYDAEYIYRYTDTSPGDGRYYRLRDKDNEPWSKWVKRFMAIGESFERNPLVSFYKKEDCQIESSGRSQSLITLIAIYGSKTFFTGITLANVAELVWSDMAGNVIERYFYAKGYGLVGWQSASREAAISEIHEPGQRPNNVREIIPCLS